MQTILITGANRGIGLEFCQQYAQQGERVFACCRNPEAASDLQSLAADYSNVQIVALDVRNDRQMHAVADNIKQPIDVLIANAGVYGDKRGHGLGKLDYDDWLITLEINVLGAVKAVEYFLPQLRQSKQACIAAISSQMGSIDDNQSGGSLLYRSSKAALNAAMKSVAIDLKRENIGVIIFHPGWVQTDMGGSHALINTETSVKGMMQQIFEFKLSDTGCFIKYDGTVIPW